MVTQEELKQLIAQKEQQITQKEQQITQNKEQITQNKEQITQNKQQITQKEQQITRSETSSVSVILFNSHLLSLNAGSVKGVHWIIKQLGRRYCKN